MAIPAHCFRRTITLSLRSGVCGLVALLGFAPFFSGEAAIVSWDADGTLPVDGGTGVWNTAPPPRWEDGAGNYVTWNNATPDSAVFSGSAGTVSLGEAITAAAITLNSQGYVIDLTGFNLTSNGAIGGTGGGSLSSNTITNTGSLATLTVGGLATAGPRLTGAMNVVYNGTGWNPAVSTHDFTGTLSLLGSGLIRSDGVPLGSPTGLVRLGGTHTLQLGTESGQFRTFTRDLEVLNSTTSITTGGLRTLTLAGNISGAGEFRQGATQGAIVLTGNNTYTGPTYVAGAGPTLIAASNTAFGNSTLVETRQGPGGNVTASTIGFQGNITIGSAADILLPGANPASGLGALQNFGGHNRFGGDIELGSNTPRVFGIVADSSLTLTGEIRLERGFTKVGSGTLVLTGQNTYGTSSSATQGWTAVNDGIVRLDFSQTAPGHDVDILNFGNSSNTAATYLSLGGGTLEIQGRPGALNSQRFKNNDTAGLGFTINPGASAVRAVQNGAEILNSDLGQINTRNVGGTVDFTLPTRGSFSLPVGTLPTEGTRNIIIANGTPFMTVAGSDWAARDGTSPFIVPGGMDPGFYTPNTANSLVGNADMSGPVNTTLTNNTTVTSLRFNNAVSSTITATGQTLTAGGILVTPNVGNNSTTINGGTLRAEIGDDVTRQDLVVIQNNPANQLVISSVIADPVNASPGALTKSGAGQLVLSGANTYTGVTTANGGVLRLENAAALGPGNLAFNGGVLGLTAASGDFTRALGTGPGQVRFLGSGGFTAYGGDRIVNLGGAAAALSWNNSNFVPTMSRLILSSADADGTVILQNGINTLPAAASPISRTFHVENGAAAVDARLTGVIAQEGGIIKTGAGTLELTAANTYSGPTSIDQGILLVTGSLSASSPVSIRTGGTLRGNGTVGPIAVAGGTLGPGTAVGALNSGSTAFNGGTFALEIIDAATFDQLNVTGAVTFNAPTALSLTVSSPLTNGTAFSIITNNGIDDIIFADGNARLLYNGVPLNEGDTFTVAAGFGPQQFQISYLGDTGNDLVLTAIPEPASLALLTMSIGTWLCTSRFRRSAGL